MFSNLLGELGGIAALAAGLLAIIGGLLWKAKQAGVDAQKAKEAKARNENLTRIKQAADARPTVPVDRDPNNRDVA